MSSNAAAAKASAEAVSGTRFMTGLKVGGAALGAGALLALTGGLAAPAIAAGLGGLVSLTGGSAAIGGAVAGLGTTAGAAAISGTLGAYGAVHGATRTHRLVAGVEEFGYVDLGSEAWLCQQLGGRSSSSPAAVPPALSRLSPLLEVPYSEARAEDGAASVTIAVNGWVNSPGLGDFFVPWVNCPNAFGNRFAVVWEPELLRGLGGTLARMVRDKVVQEAGKQVLNAMALGTLYAAMSLPMAALSALDLILGDQWSCVLNRSKAAGVLLAHQLAAHCAGARPVTLVAFSMGARLVFHCLLELHRMGRRGIVQNAVLIGTPVSISVDRWRQARSVVSGRFVNAYNDRDWVLGLIYRMKTVNGMINSVSGLTPVEGVDGVENVGVGKIVSGHEEYLPNMAEVLEMLVLNN